METRQGPPADQRPVPEKKKGDRPPPSPAESNRPLPSKTSVAHRHREGQALLCPAGHPREGRPTEQEGMTVTATGTVHFADALPLVRDQAGRTPAPGAHFTQIATAVVRGRSLGLSPWAKLLYVVLRSYAAPDGTCFPGYATLQADVGCGINQLTRAVRELEAVGLVARRRRGQGRPTLYTVRSPGERIPGATQTPVNREPCFTPSVKLESLQRVAEQDSVELDPEEQHHPQPPRKLAPTPIGRRDPSGASDDVLVAALIAHGVTPSVAQGLVTSYSPTTIRQQLNWLPHRSPAKNPAGQLVLAIREGWPEPPDVAAAQKRTAAAAHRAEEAKRNDLEDEARRREWEAKPPEERIAGRLAFWIQGRRAKRHEPTPAEIAGRKAELLAELAAGGGVS